MQNFISIFYFIILNLLLALNIIPILGAFLGIVMGILSYGVYDATSMEDSSGFGLFVVLLYTIGLGYTLFFPLKLIVYPIMYENLESSNIIHKFFDKCRTNRHSAIIAILISFLIDCLIYSYTPKNLITLLDDFIPIYKESQLVGLTCCMFTLLLWFKVRKPEHNGKRLFLFYIALIIIFSVIIYIFKDSIISL